MNILLDTQAFLWVDHDSAKLSAHAKDLCRAPENRLFFSYVSVWEIQIKTKLKKLSLPVSIETVVTKQRANGIALLPIELAHLYALNTIPLYPEHSDPFDRLLIAQCVHEKYALLSSDDKMTKYHYPITVLW